MKNYISEPERKIAIEKEYAVCVAGGGIAGIAAAFAGGNTDNSTNPHDETCGWSLYIG